MVIKYGSAKEALEVHLDNCPAAFTVSYDNIDMGRTPNEFLGDAAVDQSLHWCGGVSNNIKQYYVNCDTPEAKYCSIANKFDVVTIGLALIFCHTRKMPAGWWRR